MEQTVLPQDTALFSEMQRLAHDILPEGSQVWLYGSRARGEATCDSDWDILILVNKASIKSSDEDDYSFPFVMAGWHHASSVSPMLYTFEDWKRRAHTPFYANVEHDKIGVAI